MLIDRMRTSRKNPSVLKLQLIKIRSSRPNTLVFIFEGPDDIGVYETWIKKINSSLHYEPLPGSGKEQLHSLHAALKETNDHLIDKVYFFVDCDFDKYSSAENNLYTLDAYSIENLLCCHSVLESVLSDEFRCAGSPEERQLIIDIYQKIHHEFSTHTEELNFLLFAARRLNINICKKPNTVTDFVEINIQSINKKNIPISDLISLERMPTAAELESLRDEFILLPSQRAQRGKYVLDMFRKWLKQLENDNRCDTPILFNSRNRVSGEPSNLNMRRFSIASPIPSGLEDFIFGVTP